MCFSIKSSFMSVCLNNTAIDDTTIFQERQMIYRKNGAILLLFELRLYNKIINYHLMLAWRAWIMKFTTLTKHQVKRIDS